MPSAWQKHIKLKYIIIYPIIKFIVSWEDKESLQFEF